MNLYDQITLECSKIITHKYSTSFSLGIQILDKKYRGPIYSIYGFVRVADEIVDTFHDHDRKALLEQFKKDTFTAIKDKISLNPVLNSFQRVVNEYEIDKELIEAFLYSMEMDLYHDSYDQKNYDRYIYGSAEVVGLMCLKVFTDGDPGLYNELEDSARRLGAAFQKVNFLRDIKSDYHDRGRIYFPGIDFKQFKSDEKARIELEIQEDFKAAYQGIKRLPNGSKKGVYLAYIYYLKLFNKIKRLSASTILDKRIRIPNAEKIILIFPALFRNTFSSV